MTRAEQISRVYDQLKELQLSKNADYGNSAFDDVEVFGEIIPAKNGILARIADKLKRLRIVTGKVAVPLVGHRP